MFNLIKLVFAAVVLLSSYNVFAHTHGPFHQCAKGWIMQGSVAGNDVWCEKAERVRKNKPVCGVKRYKLDADGLRDRCVRKGKPDTRSHWTQPKCVGGSYVAISGYDECRGRSKTSKRFFCKTGWTMIGSITFDGARGVIHCSRPGKKLKNPACGFKRYKLDADGIRDRCVRKNKPDVRRHWGQPRCVGGSYVAVSGYDECRGKDKSHHPWRR